MSQHERSIKQHLDLYMEEQRLLHREVISAVGEAKLAAAEARNAADSFSTSSTEIKAWTISLQKRVDRLERFNSLVIGGGVVAGAALWDKAKKVLGLGS